MILMCSFWKLLPRSCFFGDVVVSWLLVHMHLYAWKVLSDAVYTFLPWQIYHHSWMRISHYNIQFTRTCCFPSPRLSSQRRVRPLLGESEIKQIKKAEGCTCQKALCWICPGGILLANFQKLDCVCVCPTVEFCVQACDRQRHLSACGRMRGNSTSTIKQRDIFPDFPNFSHSWDYGAVSAQYHGSLCKWKD